MTQIQATIKDSASVPLVGYILVRLSARVTDEDTLYTPISRKVELVNGKATFDLEPTEQLRVPYVFEVYQYTTDGDILAVPGFQATVPDSSTPILFKDLAQQSGVAQDSLDTSYLSIVRRLYNDEAFWQKFRQEFTNYRGQYTSTTWYRQGDEVTYEGSSYVYVASVNSAGTLPTSTSVWQLRAARGETGTGTTGNSTTYSTSWIGQQDAPSRSTIYTWGETLARKSELTGFIEKSNPVLANNPGSSSNSLEIASTNWVREFALPKLNAYLDGTPSTSTPVSTDSSNKIATTKYVSNRLDGYIGNTYSTNTRRVSVGSLTLLTGYVGVTLDGNGNGSFFWEQSLASNPTFVTLIPQMSSGYSQPIALAITSFDRFGCIITCRPSGLTSVGCYFFAVV